MKISVFFSIILLTACSVKEDKLTGLWFSFDENEGYTEYQLRDSLVTQNGNLVSSFPCYLVIKQNKLIQFDYFTNNEKVLGEIINADVNQIIYVNKKDSIHLKKIIEPESEDDYFTRRKVYYTNIGKPFSEDTFSVSIDENE